MTEQERKAIEQLERVSSMLGAIGETEDYTEVATNALEEIQQYRSLESRLSDMFGGALPLDKYVDELEFALKEPGNQHPMNAKILTYEDAEKWEAYKAIGTVNEFKALKEDWLNKFDLLVEYRKIGTVEECRAAVEKQKEIRNKAIDDFVSEVCKKFTEYERNGVYRLYCCEIKQGIADIAEQLKGGGVDE